MNDEIRSLFPITRDRIYLNCAAEGPLPSPVLETAKTYLDNVLKDGCSRSDPIARELAPVIGPFIGCDPDLVTFTFNTTFGIGQIALGLRWEKGDNVVTCDQEYPANIYPWLRLEQEGVEVRIVKSEGFRVPVEKMAEAVDDNTRVISVSWVEFFTGFRHDLKALADLAHDHGAYLVVDAMQGMGTMPFNMEELGVDAVAFGTVKWLLSTCGCGVLGFSRKLFEEVDVAIPGAFSVKDPWNFTDYRLDYLDNADRFLSGGLPFMILHCLLTSIRLMQEIGIEKIGRHIKNLTDRLAEGLERKGYRIISPRGPGEWSAIVTFEPGGHDAVKLVEELLSKKISVAARLGYIRVSPHFFIIPEEIDRLIEELPEPV
ncbi:MAG: aminotransferase class V-fold PLP-dependent enzyme [Planctomycetota bacterium]|nr:MAG: aminotransferase class V-fold PLP-dependent enzyme [Planctomycetota bacterium]